MEQEAHTKRVELHHNPLHIFKASKTPAGLYARQKWLGESKTSKWQDDFHETLHTLLSGQSEDGSWYRSLPETVRRLFGLHLTQRNKTLEIEKALDWLTRRTLTNENLSSMMMPVEPVSPDSYRGLPFVPGQTRTSLVSITLFLAVVFQQGKEPSVLAHYDLLSQWVIEHAGCKHSWPDKSNALRALVVHTDFGEDPATIGLASDLAEMQELSGQWPSPISFYQTVNALAHLHIKQAERQWESVCVRLLNTQNTDGSWGQEDREWNTFLVVHALKNKGCL